jgi:hypothetical protein
MSVESAQSLLKDLAAEPAAERQPNTADLLMQRVTLRNCPVRVRYFQPHEATDLTLGVGHDPEQASQRLVKEAVIDYPSTGAVVAVNYDQGAAALRTPGRLLRVDNSNQLTVAVGITARRRRTGRVPA